MTDNDKPAATGPRQGASPRKGAGETTHNALNLSQQIRLLDELRRSQKDLQDSRPGYAEACAMLSQKLGFPVTEANLYRLRKATGVDWSPRKKFPPKSSRYGYGYKARVQVLERRVDQLRLAVLTLCARLGETPPDPVAEAAWAEPAEE
jgi:hypothetical protein